MTHILQKAFFKHALVSFPTHFLINVFVPVHRKPENCGAKSCECMISVHHEACCRSGHRQQHVFSFRNCNTVPHPVPDTHASHNSRSKEIIEKVVAWFEEDKEHNRIHNFYNEKKAKDVYMVALRDEDGALIGYYEKHEYRARDEEPYYNF